MAGCVWREMALRVYDSPVFLEVTDIDGLIVRENCQASENPCADLSRDGGANSQAHRPALGTL
jgi:hypothetical protein